MKKTFHQKARIAWRRGQWATVEEFLRGEAQKRKVGPGMHEPDDGTSPMSAYFGNVRNNGHVEACPRLDQLERRLR